MKKTLLFLFVLGALSITAQENKASDEEKDKAQEELDPTSESQFFNSFVPTNTVNEFVTRGAPGGNDAFTVVKPIVEIQGNKFLEKKWNNRGTIRTLAGKQITVGNINYELEEGVFALQSKESLFLLDGGKYSEVIFNGTPFKYMYNPLTKQKRYYEVISETESFTLLKDNYLSVRETGSNNPGYGQKVEQTYSAKSRYFIQKGDNFNDFTLKKSNILALTDKPSEVTSYAKKNKLSFKKTSDLKKILTYAQSL